MIKLTINDLIDIANNYVLTKHSIQRIKERGVFSKSIIQDSIINSKLAYYNTDNSINVQMNDTDNYYVFKKDKDKYVMITYKGASLNNVSLADKFELAKKGIKYFSKSSWQQ